MPSQGWVAYKAPPRLARGVRWINKAAPAVPPTYPRDGRTSCMEQSDGDTFYKLCYTNALSSFWWGESILDPFDEPLEPLEAFTSVPVMPPMAQWAKLLLPAPPSPLTATIRIELDTLSPQKETYRSWYKPLYWAMTGSCTLTTLKKHTMTKNTFQVNSFFPLARNGRPEGAYGHH